MTTNSIREKIILADIELITAINSIKTVKRVMPDYSALKQFALTQFPIAAIVGRLPVPNEHKTGRKAGGVDKILSDIKVDVYVYAEANKDPDTTVSNLADDVWAALYSDQTLGDLVFETTLTVNENVEMWTPFVAFQMTAKHKYLHDTGGI